MVVLPRGGGGVLSVLKFMLGNVQKECLLRTIRITENLVWFFYL